MQSLTPMSISQARTPLGARNCARLSRQCTPARTLTRRSATTVLRTSSSGWRTTRSPRRSQAVRRLFGYVPRADASARHVVAPVPSTDEPDLGAKHGQQPLRHGRRLLERHGPPAELPLLHGQPSAGLPQVHLKRLRYCSRRRGARASLPRTRVRTHDARGFERRERHRRDELPVCGHTARHDERAEGLYALRPRSRMGQACRAGDDRAQRRRREDAQAERGLALRGRGPAGQYTFDLSFPATIDVVQGAVGVSVSRGPLLFASDIFRQETTLATSSVRPHPVLVSTPKY
jgi:hypothetical protein